MPHNDPDDKVHLAGEGLLADSQEPAAVEAAALRARRTGEGQGGHPRGYRE